MPSDDYLNSRSLPADEREVVEHHLSQIRLNNARSIRLRVANGHHLLAIKRLIQHGGWLAWMLGEAASGYHSARTIERDMALADALGDSLDGFTDEQLARSTNLTALRELTGDPNADALSAALGLLKQGIAVMPQQANALVEIGFCDPRLLDAVVEGRMTIADAKAVVAKLNQPLLEDVAELVITSGVRSPEVVDALQALSETNIAAFDAVAASGAFYNPITETQVPLAQASATDAATALAVEDAEREARRIEVLRGWRTGRPERVADLVGQRGVVLAALAAAIPDDDREYHVYAYPEPEPEGAPEPS